MKNVHSVNNLNCHSYSYLSVKQFIMLVILNQTCGYLYKLLYLYYSATKQGLDKKLDNA